MLCTLFFVTCTKSGSARGFSDLPLPLPAFKHHYIRGEAQMKTTALFQKGMRELRKAGFIAGRYNPKLDKALYDRVDAPYAYYISFDWYKGKPDHKAVYLQWDGDDMVAVANDIISILQSVGLRVSWSGTLSSCITVEDAVV